MNIKYFSTLGYDFYTSQEVTDTEYIGIPICHPEIEPEELGSFSVSIEGSDTPSINTNAVTIGAPIMRVFSAPQNL
jgi:hypothetical protein